jgi:hypothetical protein
MSIKTNKLLRVFLALILAVLFVSGFFIFAKKDAVAEGDAIAVRVIANPQHYNPLTWYKNKKFTGNPTPLIVDGYRAIQDGRTVYVNVANVVNGTFYTNIYLISYNQNAGADTMTIFNRILANWKFNTNLTGLGVCFGRPSDTKTCTGDSQCPKGSSCVSSVCQQNCLIDSDCAGGGYCNSEKAKVVRDTNRLGDINDLKLNIDAYNSRVGHFPLLSSGTYIPGGTVSTWPSWKGEFTAELGSNPPVDLINKLGACSGYDPLTCWDGANKTFAGTLNYQMASLPANSSVYVYSTDAKGRNYHACAIMESGYLIGYNDNACPGSVSNNPLPVISCGSLIGVKNQPFYGYISVANPKNLPLSISIPDLPPNFSLTADADVSNATIYSGASPLGNYPITVKIIDNQGAEADKVCTISISDEANIVYPIPNQKILVGRTLNFSVYALSSKKDYSNMSFSFSGLAGLNCQATSITNDGRYKCDISYPTAAVWQGKINVTAANGADNFTPQSFNLNIYNNPPVMQPFKCDNVIRVNNAYPKTGICRFSAIDPDGNGIAYFQSNALPPGMSFDDATGALYGTPTVTGTFLSTFTATDNYGAVSQSLPVTFNVNDYCGDNNKETPNMEKKGGPKNDGYEDCDGLSGTPLSNQSTPSWQYGCDNNCKTLSDGYCGDYLVQDGLLKTKGKEVTNDLTIFHTKKNYGEQCDFGGSATNCCNPATCQWTTGPSISQDANDGFGNKVDFMLGNGGLGSVTMPIARGVDGGSFDTSVYYNSDSDLKGPAIVFATDLTNNGYATVPGDYITAVSNTIANLYSAADSKKANIYVGEFGFGSLTGGDACNLTNAIHYEQPILNLKNFDNNLMEGQANELLLTTQGAQKYTQLKDFSGTCSVGSADGMEFAIQRATTMLNSSPNYTSKYIILLTDGFQPSEGLAEAAIAKNAGNNVIIYTIAFDNVKQYTGGGGAPWGPIIAAMDALCQKSSDNGANCYANYFCQQPIVPPSFNCNIAQHSYVRDPNSVDAAAEATKIYQEIIGKILNNNLTNIGFTFGNVAGAFSENQKNITFNLGSVNCDISGVKQPCSPNALNFKVNFNGQGYIRITNFKLNALPLCSE